MTDLSCGLPGAVCTWLAKEGHLGCSDQPDLVVLGISAVPGRPEPGEAFDVNVTVLNQGGAGAGVFWLDWYADLPTTPEPGVDGDLYAQVSSLNPGKTYAMTEVWEYNAGIYSMYAQVDTEQEVVESDETNNVMGPRVTGVPEPASSLMQLTVLCALWLLRHRRTSRRYRC